MNIEHTAVNVESPVEMAEWYVKNMGLEIVFSMKDAPFTHFVADEKGGVIEIYSNKQAEIPDYKNMHPLMLHLAFVSENPDADRMKLEKAGASFVEEVKLPDGSHLVMMRDPWGLAVQLCKRGKPMV